MKIADFRCKICEQEFLTYHYAKVSQNSYIGSSNPLEAKRFLFFLLTIFLGYIESLSIF